MLQLQYVWHDFLSLLLFDLSPEYLSCPAELDHFKVLQNERCDKVREELKKQWFTSVVEVFVQERLGDYFLHANVADRFFRTVSALMVKQLRALFQDSMGTYVEYFEKFGANAEKKSEPAFYIKIVPQNTMIRLQPGADEFENIVFQVLEYARIAVSNFAVVEPKFLPSLQHLYSMAPAALQDQLDHPESVHKMAIEVVQKINDAHRAESSLRVVQADDRTMYEAKQQIKAILTDNFQGPRQLLALYEEHAYLLSMDVQKFVKEFKKNSPSLDRYAEEIIKFRQQADTIMATTVNEVASGMFMVQCEPVKRGLSSQALKVADCLLKQINDDSVEELQGICGRFEAISQRVMERPSNSTALKDLKKYMAANPKELKALNLKIEEAKLRMQFLEDYMFAELSEDDAALQVRTLNWPNKIKPIIEDAEKKLAETGEKMEDNLRSVQAKFQEDLNQCTEQVARFDTLSAMERAADYLKEEIALKEALMSLKEQLEVINSQEELFGWSQSRFPVLDKNLTELEPFEQLYQTVADFAEAQKGYMKGSLLKLQFEDIEKFVGDTWRALFKLKKSLNGKPEPLKLLENAQKDVEKFKVR
jgi:dynein heavy chain